MSSHLHQAEIISIGDELLYGHVQDTNATWISNCLGEAGFQVIHRATVPDDSQAILTAFSEAETRASVIVVTGGLGPTSDDLTKPCFCTYFECDMVLNESALEEVTALFARRGIALTEANRSQAYLPAACIKLTNQLGTAPGMWFDKGEKTFIALPGVPYEMKQLMQEEAMPRLLKKYKPQTLLHRTVRTVAIGESFLASKIADWEAALPSDLHLAYLPKPGQVKLRLTTYGLEKTALQQKLDQQIKELVSLIEPHVYGFDHEELEEAVGNLLKKQAYTVSVAESCTGGYLGHLLTKVPGASTYFSGGVIAYSNVIKENVLQVKAETLQHHGAVSEQTVREMALGLRQLFKTTHAIAVSGIAGPDGGTPEKPVGTIWIAVADEKEIRTKKFTLHTDRLVNIEFAAIYALNGLRKLLLKQVW
jgi:nicotinamide-nucleotide amidase